LGAAVEPQREQAGARTVVVGAKRQLANGRVIDLQRRSVLTILAIKRALQERAAAISEEPLNASVAAAVLHVDRRIDGTAHVLRNGDVAVGAKAFAAAAQRPVAEAHRAPSGAEG